MAHVEFFNREVSSVEAESQRLEKLKKVKKLLRKARRQSRIMQKQDLKLEAWEAEVFRIYGALETRTKVIKKLEDEVGELRVVLDQVQDEKNVLLEKLELAEISASSISKIGGEGIKIEEVLEKEIEQLQKDRAAELKELVY
ncbi:unnamed protein product [Prunus armeniaca]|uniref:Uncharacterized protein n=1 Tax=Prunus armeniaca TaxID=36596 RepID=A0A6J5XUX7_PRUAR|nr:unnamed protein product [Prunus armeniaca]